MGHSAIMVNPGECPERWLNMNAWRGGMAAARCVVQISGGLIKMDQCFKVIKKTIEDTSALCYVSKAQIPSWKKYIALTEDFCKVYDYDQNLFALNCKKSAVSPLLHYKKDSDVYINTCRKISAALKSGHSVTREAVIAFMGMTPATPPVKQTVEITPAPPRFVARNSKASTATSKNASLIAALDTPQLNIIRDVMKREGKGNEYEAMVFVLKFWKENRKI